MLKESWPIATWLLLWGTQQWCILQNFSPTKRFKGRSSVSMNAWEVFWAVALEQQEKAVVQTSATDLIDGVSYANLHWENIHLHWTLSSQHNNPCIFFSLVNSFSWNPAGFFFCSQTVCPHLLSMCAPVFSLSPLLTSHWSQTPAF